MPSFRQLASYVPGLGQSGIRGDAEGNPSAAPAIPDHGHPMPSRLRLVCIVPRVLSYSFVIGIVPTFQYFQYS